MLLTADIGNTNITLGVFSEDVLLFTARLATDSRLTSDQYAIDIKDVLALNGVGYSEIEDAVICSVVPVVGSAVAEAVSKLCSIVPLIIGPGVKTGLNIKIDNPAQLGADLVAGAVGAISKCKLPCIILDLGTATTISVVDKSGNFLGGSICAGIGITLDALSSKTSQLPRISIEAPKSPIGSNTVDSMKSGLVLGSASMIDGMITRIEKQLGESATVIGTGGLCSMVVKHCEKEIIVDDNLLLEGLKIIYQKNI